MEFRGKMRLPADPLNVVGADLEVGEGSLALIVSRHEIGEWPLDEVTVQMEVDGFHVRVDGEEFIFMTPDRSLLAEALGVGTASASSSKRKARKRSARDGAAKPAKIVKAKPIEPSANGKSPRPVKKSKAPKPAPAPSEPPRWTVNWHDRRVRLLGGLLLALIAMGILARGLLTALLLFAGISGVVVAGAAILDPLLRARLPEALTPMKWAVIGLAATASGMVLLIV